jgi:hypothetical protein|tara:strand:- start:52 stop:660 length:609 start_codon:yes stop_codon:yes gene_type:complete
MNINIKADTKEINKSLTSFQKKQIPFATSKAINKTAFQTRRQLQKDMDNIFRKGATGFTKKGVFVKPSNKSNLQGNVYILKEQAKYLERQVFGGIRRESFAIPIPFRNRIGLTNQGNLTKAKFKSLVNNKNNKILDVNGVKGLYEIKKDSKPKLLVALNRRSVSYDNPKFKFFALGRRAVNKFFLKNYRKELDKAIRSAKKK